MTVAPDLAEKLRSVARGAKERDDLIRQAYAAGGGIREIARLVELSHTTVARIVGNDESAPSQ